VEHEQPCTDQLIGQLWKQLVSVTVGKVGRVEHLNAVLSMTTFHCNYLG